jgi:hypothetical protein
MDPLVLAGLDSFELFAGAAGFDPLGWFGAGLDVSLKLATASSGSHFLVLSAGIKTKLEELSSIAILEDSSELMGTMTFQGPFPAV